MGALLMFLFFPTSVEAQTCSCAGAPLISSQSLTTVSGGNAVFGLTWEHHDISSLYSGTQELENRTQERSTNTALLEVNYGITDRIALTSTFTFIEKNRVTGFQNPGSSNYTTVRNFGDGMAMLKYNIVNQSLWQPHQLSVGLGAKIPLATTSMKVNGLSLNADMQPGTGAWDGIGWLYASRTLRAYNMSVFLNGSVRLTGSNERFNENDRYRFGNELVLFSGISGSLFDKTSQTLIFKYRTTSSDTRNGSVMPNTGGQWFSIKPSIGYQLLDRMNVQLNAEIPLYQHLKGTQPTTSYIISGSIFVSLKKSETGFKLGR